MHDNGYANQYIQLISFEIFLLSCYYQEHIKEGAANSQWFGQTILYRKST